MSYGTRNEIKAALAAKIGHVLQRIESNKKRREDFPDDKTLIRHSREYHKDLYRLQSAYKEFSDCETIKTNMEKLMKSLREIYLSE